MVSDLTNKVSKDLGGNAEAVRREILCHAEER